MLIFYEIFPTVGKFKIHKLHNLMNEIKWIKPQKGIDKR